jgi:hypothetical protein
MEQNDDIVKDLEKEIADKTAKLNSIKYADYEAAKANYEMATEQYQVAYQNLADAKRRLYEETNKKVQAATTNFFKGRAF